MKTWADFYQFCGADVPGVSIFAAERELRRAAQEFCERTKAWKEDLDPAYIFPNVELYDVETPKGATILKIAEIKQDGHNIHLMTPDSGYRSGVEFISPMQFRMVPMPVSRSILRMRAVLQPDHDAPGVADLIYNQYAELIGAGAKARLYLQPEKPYTNPALAAVEKEKFEQGIARVKLDAAKGYSGAPLRTRAFYF